MLLLCALKTFEGTIYTVELTCKTPDMEVHQRAQPKLYFHECPDISYGWAHFGGCSYREMAGHVRHCFIHLRSIERQYGC